MSEFFDELLTGFNEAISLERDVYFYRTER